MKWVSSMSIRASNAVVSRISDFVIPTAASGRAAMASAPARGRHCRAELMGSNERLVEESDRNVEVHCSRLIRREDGVCPSQVRCRGDMHPRGTRRGFAYRLRRSCCQKSREITSGLFSELLQREVADGRVDVFTGGLRIAGGQTGTTTLEQYHAVLGMSAQQPRELSLACARSRTRSAPARFAAAVINFQPDMPRSCLINTEAA